MPKAAGQFELTVTPTPFLTDIQALRYRARRGIANASKTFTYEGDAQTTIGILQSVLATEIVCESRYAMQAVKASASANAWIKAGFARYAMDEQGNSAAVVERINQLGGVADFNPRGLVTRARPGCGAEEDLIDMIRENLVAEAIAMDHCRELIRYFGRGDPVTRSMLEGILATEERHVKETYDFLLNHEDRPML